MRFSTQNRKNIATFILISVLSYLVFFYPTLNSHSETIVAGSDAFQNHYPTRAYLFEKLRAGHFPIWTERIFSGYPIYADVERAYLHPINVLSVLLLGPFWSYKFLHFTAYLFGSLGLFLLLKQYNIKSNISFFAANFAYFFSFYQMYHQQHFVIILVTYLFPLNIYFLEMFLSQKKIRYLLGNLFLILSGIYLGSFQTVLMICLAQCLYAFGRLDKKKVITLVFYSLFLISFSLPLLIPSYNLFKQTTRFEESVTYTQGSFHPLMLINLVYPYFFGDGPYYKANQVNSDYLIHETYIYIGITTFIFGILGLISLKNQHLKRFSLALCLFFLVFGLIGFVPVLNNVDFPVFSMFRYWGRAIFLLSFAFALFVANFVEKPAFSEKLKLKHFKEVIYGIAFLLLLTILSLKNEKTQILVKVILGKPFDLDFVFFYWSIVFVLIAVFVYFVFKKTLGIKQLQYFATLLIFADLAMFSSLTINNYISSLTEVYLPLTYKIPLKLENQRIVEKNDKLGWNLNLYYPSWGIFGYSQFTPAIYNNHLLSLGLKGHKKFLTESDNNYATQEFFNSTVKLGVEKVLDGESLVTPLPSNTSVLLGAEFVEKIYLLVVQEGLFKFDVEVEVPTMVETKIRSNEHWQLLINGEKTNFANDPDDVYLNYNLPKGFHTVELKYVPTDLYLGIKLFGISATILISAFFIARKKDYVVKEI